MDESSKIIRKDNFFFQNKSLLYLIILPTEWCNFRCVYCYEPFDNKVKLMDQSVINGVKLLIKNNIEKVDVLSISWFGGEPLIGYPIIIDIMKFVNELKQKHNFELISDITTNAYALSKDRFEELVKLGVTNYQITFDGDKETHDKLRIRLDKKPTFETIYNHLLEYKQLPQNFLITIRIHLNKYNKESIKKLLERLAKDLKGDKRYQFFIRQISSLYKKDNSDLEITDYKEILNELYNYAKELGLNTENFDGVSACYASHPRSFVIKPDGSIAKCTVDMYSDRGIIGKLRDDGTLELDMEKYKWWIRGIYTKNPSTLRCPLYSDSQ